MMGLVPLQEAVFLSPLAYEDSLKAAICKPGRFLTRNQIGQHLDRLPSLQSFEKMFLLFKPVYGF